MHFLLTLVFALFLTAYGDYEEDEYRVRACPTIERPRDATKDCVYYCGRENGTPRYKYGFYIDGIRCDYYKPNDGVCKGGMCQPPHYHNNPNDASIEYYYDYY